MSKEITIDMKLQWAIEKIGERDKQISGLISKNIALREELQANISLRDHFAGLAMQTLPKEIPDMETLARLSYNMADAMLAERDKKYDNI